MSNVQGARLPTQPTNLAALGLCALTLAACWPALFAGFVWDDRILAGAAVVREWSGLWHIWFSPGIIPGEHHYWPVAYTSHWLEHKLWGLSAFSTHLVNILLHVANALLLWRILGRLGAPGAWLAAAVFAIHPVHIEVAVYVSARGHLLTTLFSLCAVQVWLRFHGRATDTADEQPEMRHHVLLAVLLLAALLSKSVAVTLPVALLLLCWWQQGRVSRAALLHSIPLFVLVALVTAFDLYVYLPSQKGLDIDYSLLERVLIAAQSLCFYLGKLLWPLDLAVIYPHWHIGAARSWLSLLAVLLMALLLWRYYRLGRRGPVAAMLFFVLTLLPVLGLTEFGYMNLSFVADRYQYLASVGPLALAVAAVVRLAGAMAAGEGDGRTPRRHMLAPGAALTLGVLTWLSVEQAGIYENEARFYRHILAHNPRATSAWSDLSWFLYRQGRMQETLETTQAALAQGVNSRLPHHYFALHHLTGLTLLELGQHRKARWHLHEALKGERVAIVSHHQAVAGEALREGRHEEALVLLRVLTEARPKQAQSWASLGEALWRTGQYTETITALERAISLDSGLPTRPSIHALIARSAEALEQPERAVQHYTQALALDPDLLPALKHLGYLQFTLGNHAEALDAWQRLVARAPDNAQAHSSLGAVLAELGQTEAARQSLRQALALDPTLASARENLQRLEAGDE